MSAPHQKSVAVLIATCRRPEGLKNLLLGLDREARTCPEFALKAVIADNDLEGSAAELVEALRPELQLEVIYGQEPRPGIPFARNRSLDLAAGQADWFIFVDDDEVPRANWLRELFRMMDESEPEVVTGPVVPQFQTPPPAWMMAGGFLQYHRHATGTELDRAYTNNTLVAAATLKRFNLRFDERMAATGGSDTHFFRRLHQAGGRIVWNDLAIVDELIPESRSDAAWIYQRAFRIGNSSAFIEQDLFGRLSALVRILPIGCYRILKGLLSYPLALLKGRPQTVTAWRHVTYGAGLIAGLCGYRYQEYRRIHGR